jgi:putative esterase
MRLITWGTGERKLMSQRMRTRRRRPWGSMLAVLVAGSLLAAAPAGATASQRRTHTGFIDGAEYRVEIPERWNGTLVLYSHGYYPVVFEEPPLMLTNRPGETEAWLLDHGYAVAGSNFKGVRGATYEQALRDQLALLDWFDANVGRPRHTIALGSSSGGALSVMLAERDPHRFAGVASLCPPMDLNGQWNTFLDVSFAIKTLLGSSEIELVNVTNPQRSLELLQEAVTKATESKAGRAKLALAAALGNVPGWLAADAPRSTGLAEQLSEQVTQLQLAYVLSFGPFARVDLEGRAGGNPSWNVGVDYRRQLARSAERDLVRAAYREAKIDLGADLDKLAAAPRVAADPAAAGWLRRFGVPRGTTPTPVITVHNVADAAEPGHERWYAEQVRHNGNPNRLRQLYAGRAGHCSFTAAEEIVVLRALFERIETGRWPHLDPRRLNAAAGTFGPAFHDATDLKTFKDVVVPPSFTRFVPPRPMRPTR